MFSSDGFAYASRAATTVTELADAPPLIACRKLAAAEASGAIGP
jgi:hypothetical protein